MLVKLARSFGGCQQISLSLTIQFYVELRLSWAVTIQLHWGGRDFGQTKEHLENQLPLLSASVLKVCVMGWWCRVPLNYVVTPTFNWVDTHIGHI